MLRKRLLISLSVGLSGFLLAASGAWADGSGYVDCASHPDDVQVFSKARTTTDVVARVACNETFTILLYGFIFSRIQTKDGQIGYVYSNLITAGRTAGSAPAAAQAQAAPKAPRTTTAPGSTLPAAEVREPVITGAGERVGWSPQTPASQPEAAASVSTAVETKPATAAPSPAPAAEVKAAAAQPVPAVNAPAATSAASSTAAATNSAPTATAPAPAAPASAASQKFAAEEAAAAARLTAEQNASAAAATPATPTTPAAQTAPAAAAAAASPSSSASPAGFTTPPPMPLTTADSGSTPSIPAEASAQPSATSAEAPPQPEAAPAEPAPIRNPRVSERWERPNAGARRTTPLFDLFGGYAFVRFVSAGTATNFNGVMGSFAWNFKPWVQVIADSSYNAVTVSGTKNVLYGNHWGPRVFLRGMNLRNRWGISPFAEALVGGSRADTTVSGAGGYSTSENCLSFKVGGGVDIRPSRMLQIRLLDVDYYRTSFASAHQNNYWATAGIVLRLFGGREE